MAQEKIDETTPFQDNQSDPYLEELQRADQEVPALYKLVVTIRGVVPAGMGRKNSSFNATR